MPSSCSPIQPVAVNMLLQDGKIRCFDWRGRSAEPAVGLLSDMGKDIRVRSGICSGYRQPCPGRKGCSWSSSVGLRQVLMVVVVDGSREQVTTEWR
jgi:hypothetical protein